MISALSGESFSSSQIKAVLEPLQINGPQSLASKEQEHYLSMVEFHIDQFNAAQYKTYQLLAERFRLQRQLETQLKNSHTWRQEEPLYGSKSMILAIEFVEWMNTADFTGCHKNYFQRHQEQFLKFLDIFKENSRKEVIGHTDLQNLLVKIGMAYQHDVIGKVDVHTPRDFCANCTKRAHFETTLQYYKHHIRTITDRVSEKVIGIYYEIYGLQKQWIELRKFFRATHEVLRTPSHFINDHLQKNGVKIKDLAKLKIAIKQIVNAYFTLMLRLNEEPYYELYEPSQLCEDVFDALTSQAQQQFKNNLQRKFREVDPKMFQSYKNQSGIAKLISQWTDSMSQDELELAMKQVRIDEVELETYNSEEDELEQPQNQQERLTREILSITRGQYNLK